MTPTLTDPSCTPMTMTTKKMRTRTAVEKVRLFKREEGREVHGGQKQAHSEKTKASSGTISCRKKIKGNAIARDVKLADLKHNTDLRRTKGVEHPKYKKYLQAIKILTE